MKMAVLKNTSLLTSIPFSSNRLFNAMYMAAGEMDMDLEIMKKRLLLSNILPMDNEKPLLPLVNVNGIFPIESKDKDIKKNKKINYVPYELYTIKYEDRHDYLKRYAEQEKKMYETRTVFRNKVEDEITHFFANKKIVNGDLYFLYDNYNLEPLLKYLKDEGLGRDRNITGAFENYEIKDWQNEKGNAYLSISDVIPTGEDILKLKRGRYLIEKTGGYIDGTNLIKTNLKFVRNAITEDEIRGKILELEHDSLSYKLVVYGKSLNIRVGYYEQTN